MGFGNMSLRSKLLSGFTVVALITAVVGITGFIAINMINKDSDEVTTVRMPSIESLLIIQAEAQNIRGTIRSLGIPGLPTEIRKRQYENLAKSRETYAAAWKIYEPLPQTVEEEKTWKLFVPAWEAWRAVNNQAKAMYEQIDQTGIANPTELTKNLEQFSKDHYAAALKINHLLIANTKFDGGDDHTLCNFGRWLTSFTTTNKTLLSDIQLIAEPHKLFHQSVKKIKELAYAGKLAEAQSVYQKELMPQMEKVFGGFDSLRKQSIAALEIEKTALELSLGPVTDRQREANALLSKILKINQDESARAARNLQSISNFSRTLLFVNALVGVIAALLLGFILSNGITRPIKAAIEGMTSATEQVSAASEQLSSASQELSSGANEQASSIEETSASLEEMGGMVQNNVTNAQKAKDLAAQVKTISEQGNSSMEKLQGSMKEILVSNEKIEQLVKVIGEIGEKTQVMDEIVFQTKLLSFNASVEAERAGEHGRGFAVVAQEVGLLAQMSGKAAQEIAQIVSNSIHQAEAITTENKKKVETGNSYVVETSKYLKEIMTSATTVTEGAQQVVAASQEQATGIKQINLAMSNLDKATQQNASMAEETASTSEELSAQTGTINELVEDLVRLVDGGTATVTTNADHMPRKLPHKSAHGGGSSLAGTYKKSA